MKDTLLPVGVTFFKYSLVIWNCFVFMRIWLSIAIIRYSHLKFFDYFRSLVPRGTNMKFSVIIPSYNQPSFIEFTLKNVLDLKDRAEAEGFAVELLLFDSESPDPMPAIIEKYRNAFTYVEVRKDKGQYDAINKGIVRATGDYWTWLNTDDTLDIEGMLKVFHYLHSHPETDYCYGAIDYIDEAGRVFRSFPTYTIQWKQLVTRTPGVFQQGSFFRKAFTDKIGLLRPYNCCFDYEYVLRCLSNNAIMKVFTFKVANFRQHQVSKTGSLTPVFIREQLAISKEYGRQPWHFLSSFSKLRLVKHKLFPRK